MLILNDIESFMNKIPEKIPKREFVFYTGIKGQAIINLQIRKDIYRTRNESLLDRGKITIQEYEKIKEIIDAPGNDNLVMAEMIINFRENE